ncbi:MAG: tRNA-(ms[2]io[6]A)-hydroxylase [Pseudomonadales bacterium]
MTPESFLQCPSPVAWLHAAANNLETLLIDHANCEKKAAATALSLMMRYVEHPQLMNRLSKLAREELRHFEQVLALLRSRRIAYRHVGASRYAAGLRTLVRGNEPGRLVDLLIVGAIVEARSCERFRALQPFLDAELAGFYRGLEASESRHFTVYLDFARQLGGATIADRVQAFLALEAQLITSQDEQFRFHSGVPG